MNAALRTIAFSGPPGSGKSSLIRAIRQRLDHAEVIAMDDYAGPETLLPTELDDWLSNDGDFSSMDISRFCDALRAVKAGAPLSATRNGHSQAGSILLVEAPLGRAHRGCAPLLDISFWIDVPLDLALARNLLAFFSTAERPPAMWLEGYLNQYIAVTRRVLEHQQRIVRPRADHILDGRLSIQALTAIVLEHVHP